MLRSSTPASAGPPAALLIVASLLAAGAPASVAAAGAPDPAQDPRGQSAPEAGAAPDRAALERRRADLEAAVAAAPGAAEPWARLAEVQVQLGADDAAVAAADQAIALGAAGDLACDAHLAAAAAERRRGSAAAAVRRYQQALAADNDRLPALTGLAVTLAQAGLYREAMAVYGIWIQEEPANPVPRLGAATAMILAGEHARARIVLEQAREAMPDNLGVLDLLARHLAASPDLAVRDGARAVALAQELVAKVPSPESHETLAMAYAQAGAPTQAVEVQERLLAELGAEADEATRARWRANLERYRSGRSCCAELTP